MKIQRYHNCMRAVALQSGSNGNCFYIEAGKLKFLVDAGISGRQAELRLQNLGIDIREVDFLLISHDHIDHVRSAGIYQRKFGIPILATEPTMDLSLAKFNLGQIDDLDYFRSGEALCLGDVEIETIPTTHDSIDGCAFVFEHDSSRVGVLTDLGCCFEGLAETVASLDAVFIESNYDPEMLAQGPYPQNLKNRISGTGGHISNYESAELITYNGPRLQWACLSHLSEENNTPAHALKIHRNYIGDDFPLYISTRYEATPILSID